MRGEYWEVESMAKRCCKVCQDISDLGDSDLEGILGYAGVGEWSDCIMLSSS